MAIVPLIKINIVSLKKYERKILNWLQDQGIAQIEPVQTAVGSRLEADSLPKKDLADPNIEYDLAGVDFALRYLNPSKPEQKKTIWEKLAPEKIKISPEKVFGLAKDFDYQALVESIQNIESNANQINNEINKLKGEREALKPWQNFNLAPNQAKTLTAKTILGLTSQANLFSLTRELEQKVKETQIKIISEAEKEAYFALLIKKDREKYLEETLLKYKINWVELPYPEMAPKEAFEKIGAQISKAEKKLKSLGEKTKEHAQRYKKLQIIYDFLAWEKEKQLNQAKFLNTRKTFSFNGWLEKDKLHFINRHLSKITKNNVIIQKLPDPERAEEIPVIIKNAPAIAPFESVTKIYGMPKTTEIDPTPFLAPFFIVFFALCLSDAGYGIILALLSWAAIKIMKVPKENQKLFRLLIYGGVVTFIIGALFGGWFGIELETLGDSFLKSLLLKIKVVDPIKNPISILLLAFALGVLQVLAGIGVRMLWEFRQKNYWGGILDSGLWILFIISLLVWILNGQVIHSANLGTIFKWITIGLAASLILTQGRAKKNPFLKLGSGVMSLYGLVGYLSDVLSYSRLLALGLATGIIALVVNLIAFIIKDMLPSFLGWFAAIGILIGGHLFNLAINALGSFIHSGRLQFVEFFPKFMEGGGPRFKPFGRESKYVEVTK